MCDGNSVGVPQRKMEFLYCFCEKGEQRQAWPSVGASVRVLCEKKEKRQFLAQQTCVWQHQRSRSLTHLHMRCRRLDFGLSSDASNCLQLDRLNRGTLFFFSQAAISHEVYCWMVSTLF